MPRLANGRLLLDERAVSSTTQVLVLLTLGQAALSASILLPRSAAASGLAATPINVPLAAVFLATAVTTSAPVVQAFAPTFRALALVWSLPGYLALGPALWLYVDGLTSERPWRLRPQQAWHFVLFGLGVLAAVLFSALPEATQTGLLTEGREDRFLSTADGQMSFAGGVVLYAFALVVGWTIQSCYYIVLVLWRLAGYRDRLRALFASNEHRELLWLSWLVALIGGGWLLSIWSVIADHIVADSPIPTTALATWALVVTWSLAQFGLRQRPGFEGRYLDGLDETPNDADGDQIALPSSDAAVTPKYERSALKPDQANRIAAKIKEAMDKDKLYLDAGISLHKLAKHVHVPANYVSQTLNETLGETFFDFINRHRIEAAVAMVERDDQPLVEIAYSVGFNARSSFYKAFKRVTGQTPGAYRKAFRERA